jgi:NAD(P)-dependent dehydrogenase (short-subunit alcohol dehydrogenase family)
MTNNQRVALVTGGSGGLGREAALQLAKEGVDVILTYRSNAESADKTAAEIISMGQKAITLPLDVANFAGYGDFLDTLQTLLVTHLGKTNIDILVNNAGFGAHCMMSDVNEEVFDSLLNVHFKGVLLLTQKLLPLLNDGGRIINVSTGLARFSLPGYGVYAAMKGAIEVSTRYLAKELGSRNITVNAIAPGAIDNEFNAATFDQNPQVREILASQTALGRVGVSEDIGGVVSMLCSEKARWITGQRIEVSGGMML